MRPKGRTDWKKIDALTDEEIRAAAADDPDAAPVDFDWSNAKIFVPKGKLPVSLRVDPDVLDFFRSTGKGFQTRMNAVLRSYMEHEIAKRGKR